MSELSIIKIIIFGLQYLNFYYVADIFLIISIALFSTAIYRNIQIIPTLLAGLGVFTTILIISIGISNFDSHSIESSIPDLLNSLAIALIFGFINLILILILRFLNNCEVEKKPGNSEITPTAIYLTLREISTFNNVTQKPLLNSIFEQLRLSQENTQRILELQGIDISKKIELLSNIITILIENSSSIKQMEIEINKGFNELSNGLDNNIKKTDIEKICKVLQDIIVQIDSISDNELTKSLQTVMPYLKNLQQLHAQANNTFPKIEKSLTELTQGMQQVLQDNLELLENSVETQLDMAEAIKPSEDSESEEFKSVYYQAFNAMDSGEYQDAITYFSRAIELNSQEFSLLYNQSCCYALIGEIELALDTLSNAILLNEQCIEMAKTDLDFDKIRHEPKFQALLSGS
ncbi:MAG: hypothetical protein IMF12_09465 [Proteobacteria bacterium]|nr:hypothetical protein [Pseudomonadota bacterium]